MRYKILASGSDGNATIVDAEILMDCGVPYSKLKPFIKNLKLVLLTHEHGDHFKKATVRILAHQRPSLRWACCHWMVPLLIDQGVDRRNIDVVPVGVFLDYGLCKVSPFETHHNVQNCGWRIFKDGEKLLYATDLGDLDGIEAKNYDVYLLEANHTKAEIEQAVAAAQEAGEFSYRVRAAENHLSEEQAMEWLVENMGPNSVWVPMHKHRERKSTTNDGSPADSSGDC